MIICCLGDSLTEGDYGIKGKTCIANVHEKNYPYFLAKLVNAEVRNFGKCGFTSSLYLNYYKSGEVNVKDACSRHRLLSLLRGEAFSRPSLAIFVRKSATSPTVLHLSQNSNSSLVNIPYC